MVKEFLRRWIYMKIVIVGVGVMGSCLGIMLY